MAMWVWECETKRSFVAECDKWIDCSGTTRGKQAGGEGHQNDNRYDGSKCQWISGGNTRNLTGQEACKFVAGKETNKNAYCHQTEAL
jgi:hypothetical protein